MVRASYVIDALTEAVAPESVNKPNVYAFSRRLRRTARARRSARGTPRRVERLKLEGREHNHGDPEHH